MRVLVVCNDEYHHHPTKTIRRGLLWLGRVGFHPVCIEDARNWRAYDFHAYPLVICSKSNQVSTEDERLWMTKGVQGALVDYVQKGGGLLAIHSGIAGYKEVPSIRRILGGVFLHHPPQCPVTIVPQPGHPLTTGSNAFTVQDEHYFVALDDDQADVFLTTISIHGKQPAGWIRTEGKGRVGVLTPGHNLAVWQHRSYQALIANLLHWCGKKS